MKFSPISLTNSPARVLLPSFCVLIIFPISLPLPPLASFIRMPAGDGKCNHETRRRDVAWKNMFLVDKHARPSLPAFLARFSILLGKAICNLHENAWPRRVSSCMGFSLSLFNSRANDISQLNFDSIKTLFLAYYTALWYLVLGFLVSTIWRQGLIKLVGDILINPWRWNHVSQTFYSLRAKVV